MDSRAQQDAALVDRFSHHSGISDYAAPPLGKARCAVHESDHRAGQRKSPALPVARRAKIQRQDCARRAARRSFRGGIPVIDSAHQLPTVIFARKSSYGKPCAPSEPKANRP